MFALGSAFLGVERGTEGAGGRLGTCWGLMGLRDRNGFLLVDLLVVSIRVGCWPGLVRGFAEAVVWK